MDFFFKALIALLLITGYVVYTAVIRELVSLRDKVLDMYNRKDLRNLKSATDSKVLREYLSQRTLNSDYRWYTVLKLLGSYTLTVVMSLFAISFVVTHWQVAREWLDSFDRDMQEVISLVGVYTLAVILYLRFLSKEQKQLEEVSDVLETYPDKTN